jgi:predicted ATP-dependent protease
VINIERLVAMSGPIQQKGTLVLQGLLTRRFARHAPTSFDCSVTFEQLYGGVEGDRASLAEYIAIISDLADLPIRQDLAITGSVNQLGEAQVIGGVHHKVEGFFRVCQDVGEFTGEQGVVLPAGNEQHLVLRDEVANAVGEGRFRLFSVGSVDDAVELFTGLPVGDPSQPDADTVYGRVVHTLNAFDGAPAERGL